MASTNLRMIVGYERRISRPGCMDILVLQAIEQNETLGVAHASARCMYWQQRAVELVVEVDEFEQHRSRVTSARHPEDDMAKKPRLFGFGTKARPPKPSQTHGLGWLLARFGASLRSSGPASRTFADEGVFGLFVLMFGLFVWAGTHGIVRTGLVPNLAFGLA
ncbi:hypothetical protein FB451DRAFT_1478869 [Mycena latifolia]|nr:hypothetical protein FB451DRAFT_1478869 [Mycena latifolia]